MVNHLDLGHASDCHLQRVVGRANARHTRRTPLCQGPFGVNMNGCSQQVAAIFFVVYLSIIVLNTVSFIAWRRLAAPRRTIFFAVFALCSLLILDSIVLSVVYALNPALAGPPQRC
jgi:hypothetical protein